MPMADAMLAERRRGSGKELANDIAEVLPNGAAVRRGRTCPRTSRGDQPTHDASLCVLRHLR